MSPESLESYNRNETQQNFGGERYHDIERGDVDPMSLQSNQPVNQFSATPQNNTQQNQFDPVMFVKSMISGGFTPTKAQIAAASANLGGPTDSTNTWFAIFLQKLMRQARQKRSEKN